MQIGVARYLPTGQLDPAFGVGGVVTSNFQSPRAFAVAVNVDFARRVTVAAGRETLLVVRHLENGDLDATFGEGGSVISPFFPGSPAFIGGVAIDVRPQIVPIGTPSLSGPSGDRIVVVGQIENPGAQTHSVGVARYTLTGEPDPAFSDDGSLITSFQEGKSSASAVCVDADGVVVTAGGVIIPGLPPHNFSDIQFIATRHKPDGSLDPTFSQNGKVRTPFSEGFSKAFAVAFAGSGTVAAGSVLSVNEEQPSTFFEDFAVVRYLSDGSLDTTFSQNGKVTTRFAKGNAVAMAVGVDHRNRIVAAGAAGEGFGLARYLVNGNLDPDFGNGGRLTIHFDHPFEEGRAVVNALLIENDDRIVAVGESARQFAIARIREDGTLDSSFGDGGKVRHEILHGQFSDARAVALDEQQRLIVAGIVYPPSLSGSLTSAEYI